MLCLMQSSLEAVGNSTIAVHAHCLCCQCHASHTLAGRGSRSCCCAQSTAQHGAWCHAELACYWGQQGTDGHPIGLAGAFNDWRVRLQPRMCSLCSGAAAPRQFVVAAHLPMSLPDCSLCCWTVSNNHAWAWSWSWLGRFQQATGCFHTANEGLKHLRNVGAQLGTGLQEGTAPRIGHRLSLIRCDSSG